MEKLYRLIKMHEYVCVYDCCIRAVKSSKTTLQWEILLKIAARAMVITAYVDRLRTTGPTYFLNKQLAYWPFHRFVNTHSAHGDEAGPQNELLAATMLPPPPLTALISVELRPWVHVAAWTWKYDGWWCLSRNYTLRYWTFSDKIW
jgi:hypothetical protein